MPEPSHIIPFIECPSLVYSLSPGQTHDVRWPYLKLDVCVGGLS